MKGDLAGGQGQQWSGGYSYGLSQGTTGSSNKRWCERFRVLVFYSLGNWTFLHLQCEEFFFFFPCSVSTGATINNETRRSNDGAEGFILIIVIFTVYLQVPGPQKACCIQQDKEFQQNYSNNLLDGLRNYLSAYL